MPNRMRSVRTGRKGCRRDSVTGWIMPSDYAHRQHSLPTEGISGMVNNITEMLNGNKVEWRSWASSVAAGNIKSSYECRDCQRDQDGGKQYVRCRRILGSIGDWLGGAWPMQKAACIPRQT